MRRLALFGALGAASVALTAFTPTAVAQTTPTPCPTGTVFSLVRMGVIKPTGSMDGFLEAVRDHQKWYRDRGYRENTIQSMPVLERAEDGRTLKVSSTKVLYIHKNDPRLPQDKRDDAFKAFMAKYDANVEVTSLTLACLPK